MQNGNDDQIRKMARMWSLFSSPLRPDLDDIGYLTARLGDAGLQRGLILGSTPELVDLLNRRGCAVTIIDNNETVIKAMEILSQTNWAQVQIVCASWLEEQEALHGAFEVILGDNPLLFIRYPEDWHKLLGILKRYLVTDGRIIMRGFFRPVVPVAFEPFVEASLNRLSCINTEEPSEEDMKVFANEISIIRLGTALTALDAAGIICGQTRNRRIDYAREKLAPLFPDAPFDEIIEKVLYPQTGRAGELVPRSMPEWQEAARLFEEVGFALAAGPPQTREGFPDVVRCFTAVKR